MTNLEYYNDELYKLTIAGSDLCDWRREHWGETEEWCFKNRCTDCMERFLSWFDEEFVNESLIMTNCNLIEQENVQSRKYEIMDK